MLWKCYTQHASKFGKLSSGHRTGKGQFSLQSQRRAMPKNVWTTTQLYSFHMPARSCSKSFKLVFSSTWTENFQFSSWIEKRQRKERSNCQHPLDHRKSKRIPEKHLLLTILKPLIVWITTNCRKFLKSWEYQTTSPASWETCVQFKKQQLELVTEEWTGSKLGKEYINLYIVTLFI